MIQLTFNSVIRLKAISIMPHHRCCHLSHTAKAAATRLPSYAASNHPTINTILLSSFTTLSFNHQPATATATATAATPHHHHHHHHVTCQGHMKTKRVITQRQRQPHSCNLQHPTPTHAHLTPFQHSQHQRTFATTATKTKASTAKKDTAAAQQQQQSSPPQAASATASQRQDRSQTSTSVASKLSILNQPFPANRQIAICLRSIYGIGHSVAHDICAILGLNPFSRVSDLSQLGFESLKRYIERRYQPRHLAIKEEGANIMQKIKLGTYQGIRHSLALPVHGQRTHTNAKTQRKLGRARAALYGYPLLIKKASIVNKSLIQANIAAQQVRSAKEAEKRKAAAAAKKK